MRTEGKKVAEASRLSFSEDQRRDASATFSPAPNNAPGSTPTGNSSPEGAAEALDHCETGEELLAAVLAKRELDHHGTGKYRQPVEPAIDDLPQLPSHWTWASPDQLSAASRNSMAIGPFGSNLKVPDYREEGVPLVFVRHIRAESFAETHYVTPEKAGELAAHAVVGGDLLITKMGEPPGDSAIYPVGSPDAIITADCIKWRLAPGGLDPKFFNYALRTETTKRQIAKRTRGVAQKKISLERFKDIALPLPPLPEQRRIVARIEELFSRLDAGVAALRHAKAQLQRYRQSVLAAAVTGQLTLAWREQHPDTEPGEMLLKRILKRRRDQWEGKYKEPEPIPPDAHELSLGAPENWELVSMEMLIEAPQYGTSKKCSYEIEGSSVLRIPNVINGFVDSSDLKFAKFNDSEIANYSLRENDLLMVRSNGSLSIVGKTALVRSQDQHHLYAGYLIRLRPIASSVDGRFLSLTLAARPLRAQIERKAKSTSGVNNINAKEIQSLVLQLPPLAEQHQIVAEVEARITTIDHLEAELDRQITRSNGLRQSTLAAAFAGNLS